jgi:MFS family permease
VPGAVLFAIAVAAIMVAFTELGTSGTRTALIAAGVCALSTALFVAQERRARDPMLAFGLWGRRPIATANAATLLSGMAIIGLTTLLPMYVQGVLGRSALVAGFALTMMVLGWPIGATLAAKNFSRFGLRATLLFGAVLLPTGALAFVLMGQATSVVVAGVGSIVMGFGMGFLSTSAIVIIQDSVGWAERGSATASNIFSRNLGSTVGATLLGGILNFALAHRHGGGVSFDRVRTLLDHPAQTVGDAAVRAALGQALHLAFWAVLVITLLTLLAATLVPAIVLTRAPREVAAE